MIDSVVEDLMMHFLMIYWKNEILTISWSMDLAIF